MNSGTVGALSITDFIRKDAIPEMEDSDHVISSSYAQWATGTTAAGPDDHPGHYRLTRFGQFKTAVIEGYRRTVALLKIAAATLPRGVHLPVMLAISIGALFIPVAGPFIGGAGLFVTMAESLRSIDRGPTNEGYERLRTLRVPGLVSI